MARGQIQFLPAKTVRCGIGSLETFRATSFIDGAMWNPRKIRRVGRPTILQSYRAPHIPMVSDRYGIYLFEQAKETEFAPVTGPITNFDFKKFLQTYQLESPVASNFFVAIYTSESPFSGKPFHGNDVSQTWHKDHGKGQLTK